MSCTRSLWTGLALAALAAAGTPAGETVEARLLTPVSSYSTRPGTRIEALLLTPMCTAGGQALPDGATIDGIVAGVRKVGLGLIHETASMRFSFEDLHLPDGRRFPVGAQLVSVDNARERVDGEGEIHGMRATSTFSNRFNGHWEWIAVSNPAPVLPVFALETTLFRFPDPEIEYGAGTELYLKMRFPDALDNPVPCANDGEPRREDIGELQRLVSQVPEWSYSKRQRQPMDPVNVLLVGSRDELEAAFRAAGWTGARANSVRAGLRAIWAIAEGRSYENAPMRTLLLDGAEPAAVFQKSLNTFEKRHHLRIWKRPGEFHGREVWASAAMRDIAMTFSWKPFGFTHEIQEDVDPEREKVVSDLSFTGCVDSVTYVPRGDLAEDAGKTRKGIRTDGRVAVVVLNACPEPRLDVAEQTPMPKPPWLVRTVRRITLTARNHFIRDNLIWRSADGVRIGVQAARRWHRERRAERQAALASGSGPGK